MEGEGFSMNDNLEEVKPEPMTAYEWVHMAILGLITGLWIDVLVRIVGWIVWVVKGGIV